MEFPPSDEADSQCVSILGTAQIVGLSFIAQAGVVSTIAVLVFLGLVVRNVIRDRRDPGPNGPTKLIRTHIDGYILSLMFADLLQGLGAIFSAKWAAEGRVYCSDYCTAQGAIQQLGETGVAMSTLAITVHTFATVFFRWQPSRKPWLWIAVVTFIWLFLLLFVALGYALNKHKEKYEGQPYFGPTPFWCWIKEQHMPERIAGEYFWLWFCAVLNIILYPFLFFTLRGNITTDPTNWRRIRFHRRSREDMFGLPASGLRPSEPDEESRKILKAKNKEAMKMFWYPLSYTALVLPLSVARWSTFEDNNAPQRVADMDMTTTTIVLFVFGCSGLVNVLLFLFTRPNLLLFNRGRQGTQLTSNISFAPQKQLRAPSDRRSHPDQSDGGNWTYEDDYDREGSPYPYATYPPAPHSLAPLPPDFEKRSLPTEEYTQTTTVFGSEPPSHLSGLTNRHTQSTNFSQSPHSTTKSGLYPSIAVKQFTHELSQRRISDDQQQPRQSSGSSQPSAQQIKQLYLEGLRGSDGVREMDVESERIPGRGDPVRGRTLEGEDDASQGNGWENQMRNLELRISASNLNRDTSSSPIIFTSPTPPPVPQPLSMLPPPPGPPTLSVRRPSTAPNPNAGSLPTTLEPVFTRTLPSPVRTRPQFSAPTHSHGVGMRGPHSISTLPTMPQPQDGDRRIGEWNSGPSIRQNVM